MADISMDLYLAYEDGYKKGKADAVVHGHWEQVEIEDVNVKLKIATMFCPVCKRYAYTYYSYGNPCDGMNYCPNCGAKMSN